MHSTGSSLGWGLIPFCLPPEYLSTDDTTTPPSPPLYPFHGGVRIGWGFKPFLFLPVNALYWVIPGLRPNSILSVTRISIYTPPPTPISWRGENWVRLHTIPFSPRKCTILGDPWVEAFFHFVCHPNVYLQMTPLSPLTHFTAGWSLRPNKEFSFHCSPHAEIIAAQNSFPAYVKHNQSPTNFSVIFSKCHWRTTPKAEEKKFRDKRDV